MGAWSTLALAIALTLTLLSRPTRANKAPNVVILFVDDMGFYDLGCQGNTSVASPRIDALAASGVRFSQWISGASICTPSRGALLTGLPHEEVTLAEALRERGYKTHMTGKWHLGMGRENKAVWGSILAGALALRALGIVGNRGLSGLLVLEAVVFALAWYIVATYTLMNPKNCLLFRNEEIVQQPVKLANLTQRLTADALAFMQKAAHEGDKPWFLFMSYVKVHTALFNEAEFGEVNYLNNIAELDWSVGVLLDELDRLGVADDTLVWFTSDNGPFKERGHEAGSTGPLRGAKGQTFEGGIRVPGLARYPRAFSKGAVLDGAVSTMDIFPTTLALVDRALGPAKYTQPYGLIDGKDISAYASGTDKSSPHEIMFHYCGEELSAVRLDSRYKAHFSTAIWEDGLDSCPSSSICGCAGSAVQLHSPPLLFDLVEDLGESRPLNKDNFAQYEAVMTRIQEVVHAHRATFTAFPSQPNQLELWQDLSLLQCCDPPNCACDLDSTPPYSTSAE
ncbi:Arylsulfatase [Hondaea fermentalgiana]|uniref:Arylsulfatase n=1 Tax=Hondaea fermentalgiana TaxID=2315210 RepID=A0A2R5GJJ5_9STRA|nr:Arylsulfatase [Hondaea fermentalgiana]|eukprot:GBG30795.1 Arylsulfatase [Hondaea fermentalgiana]